MRGTNPIRRQVLRSDGQLEIEETFYTIQGEGPYAGLPAIFVRTSGCWLACHWCDTQFEKGIGTFVTPDALLQQVTSAAQGAPCRLIVLTGGDPLRQNIAPFCSLVVESGYHVQIETAGLQWVPGLAQHWRHWLTGLPRDASYPGVTIVCSPKTGKVCAEMDCYASAWKYIISVDDVIDLDDGLPNSSTQKNGLQQKLARPKDYSLVYLQPCDTEDPVKNKLNRDLAVSLAMRFGYRLSLQQHKTLGLR